MRLTVAPSLCLSLLSLSLYIYVDGCNSCLFRALYTLYKHILLNKYDYHVAYVSHTTKILNRYIDLTFFHICTQTQSTALHTYHVIGKYML